jgi:hypothetical protein
VVDGAEGVVFGVMRRECDGVGLIDGGQSSGAEVARNDKANDNKLCPARASFLLLMLAHSEHSVTSSCCLALASPTLVSARQRCKVRGFTMLPYSPTSPVSSRFFPQPLVGPFERFELIVI